VRCTPNLSDEGNLDQGGSGLDSKSNTGVIHPETTQNQGFQKVDQGGSGGSPQTSAKVIAAKISSEILETEVEINSQQTVQKYPDPPWSTR